MTERRVEPEELEVPTVVGGAGGAIVVPGELEMDAEAVRPHSEAGDTEQDWESPEGDDELLNTQSPEFAHLRKPKRE
jgi:hypothetical protein